MDPLSRLLDNEHHPEFETLTGNDEMIKARVVEGLQEGWTALEMSCSKI